MAADRSLPSSGGMAAFRTDLLEELEALFNGIGLWLDAVAGTNTITATITPSGTFAKGQRYILIPVAANTGVVTVNGVSLRDPAGNALTGGELIIGRRYPMIHDGTNLSLEQWPVLVGTAVYNPASLADGAGVTTTVTVTGAVLGDHVEVSFSISLASVSLEGWVSAANTVSIRFQNESGGVVDLASGTIRARIRRG